MKKILLLSLLIPSLSFASGFTRLPGTSITSVGQSSGKILAADGSGGSHWISQGAGTGNITDINTDVTASQTLTVGTTGTDFAIVDDAAGDHKFNLPNASGSARGLVKASGAQTFGIDLTISGAAPVVSALTASLPVVTSAGKALASMSYATFTSNLSAVVGDSGSGGTKGLAPAPGAGDAAAGKYLDAAGTYSVPAGGASTSTVNTTNATVTTVATVTTASNTSTLIHASVVGRRTGGSAGTAGDKAAFILTGVCKNVAGTTTIDGLFQDFGTADQGSWAGTITVSGTSCVVQVNGATNNNVTWNASTQTLVN